MCIDSLLPFPAGRKTNDMQCSARRILPSSKIRTEGYRYVPVATPAAECISTTKHLSTFLFKPSFAVHLRCHHLTSVLAPCSSPGHDTERNSFARASSCTGVARTTGYTPLMIQVLCDIVQSHRDPDIACTTFYKSSKSRYPCIYAYHGSTYIR
jgi:hypothetical protein